MSDSLATRNAVMPKKSKKLLTKFFPNSYNYRFQDLPQKLRREVRQWIYLVDRVLASEEPRGQTIITEAAYARVKASTLRRKVQRYEDSNKDWRVFVSRTKIPHWDQQLPPKFITFWLKLCEANQGKQRKAWLELRQQLWARIPIPGYPLPPEVNSETQLPRGWSYKNMCRYREEGYDLNRR